MLLIHNTDVIIHLKHITGIHNKHSEGTDIETPTAYMDVLTRLVLCMPKATIFAELQYHSPLLV